MNEASLNEIIDQNEETNLLIGTISDSLSRIEDALKSEHPVGGITIPIREYARLKDIETRFTIMRDEFLHMDYMPIHHQIILGIKDEYEKKHIVKDFLSKDFNLPGKE